MNEIFLRIHSALVSGALSKGWGGPKCRAAVDIETHIWESIMWLVLCVLCYYLSGMGERIRGMIKSIQLDLTATKLDPLWRLLDMSLAATHLALFALIVYYKWNIQSMINIIQPCHMIVLLEGIAVFSTKPLGVLITLFLLPAMTGTLLAMLWPDVGGLDQPFELHAYWIQHYLIQLVPFYLLVRRNFLAVKYAGPFTIFVGIWILAVLHFSLFEVVDLTFNVNVEFMLCPTASMEDVFALLPAHYQWPSYRSLMTYIVIVCAVIISSAYIIPTNILMRVMENKKTTNKEL